MKIAVLGAGAIGAYVGAALDRGGADVHLIARGENLRAIRRGGVRVHSPRGDFQVHPPVTDDPREVGPVDFVFLGLKAHCYATCGSLLEPLMHEGTAVVAAQNGVPWWYFHGLEGPHRGLRIESVDPGGAVTRVIAPERAIGCVVYAGTELAEPGVVVHREGTRFTIGEPAGSPGDRCERFAEAMVAGGLKCPVVDPQELRNQLWVKLMGNATLNPLSVLTRATLAQMCRHETTRQLLREMMAETLAVARAVGAEPEISIERRIEGAAKVGEHRTSTLQDLEAGKPLELAVLIDAVVELAELTGVSVPRLQTVAAAAGLLAETLGLSTAPAPAGLRAEAVAEPALSPAA